MMEDNNASNIHPLITSSSSSSPSSSSSSCWVSPAVAREHMFNKVVTPSDVGKLNRLVIPKQHAEKYFPLDRSAGGDKGLLLCFEEIGTGKPWRFRYSYWNSSQSYVMTKGWSRFVKEKKLDAGDTVSFSRGSGEDSARGRLFIDWRRRPPDPDRSSTLRPLRPVIVPWAGGGSLPPWVSGSPFSPSSIYGCTTRNTFLNNQAIGQEYLYFPTQQPRFHLGGGSRHGTIALPELLHPMPAEPKRVRLFGVNLESSPETNQQQSMQPPNPHQWGLGLPRSETRSGMDLDLHLSENQLDDQ